MSLKDDWSTSVMSLLSQQPGVDGAIRAQEARGQQKLLNSTKLPVRMMDDRAVFEAVGVVFGETDRDDPLFIEATLPEGWARKGSDHSMWSYIVDEHGRDRIAVFYKAAFYDRRAHMSLCRRFVAGYDGDHPAVIDAVVGVRFRALGNGASSFDQCRTWLDVHYPDHKDPTAYWSEEVEQSAERA